MSTEQTHGRAAACETELVYAKAPNKATDIARCHSATMRLLALSVSPADANFSCRSILAGAVPGDIFILTSCPLPLVAPHPAPSPPPAAAAVCAAIVPLLCRAVHCCLCLCRPPCALPAKSPAAQPRLQRPPRPLYPHPAATIRSLVAKSTSP